MISNKRLKHAIGFGLSLSLLIPGGIFADTVGTINGDDVNIRATNSTDAAVLAKAENGDTVTITADLEGWFRVNAPTAGLAYVSSDFVSIQHTDGTVTGTSVNIRTAPSITASVVAKVNTGDVLTVTGSTGDWYIVNYNDATAYLHKDFLSGDMLKYLGGTSSASTTETTDTADVNVYATVKCSGVLNMRASASTSSAIIVTIPNGYHLSVLGTTDGWIKVSDDSNRVGYVSSEFIELKNGTKPSNVTIGKGSSVVEYAKKFIGTPYVYGGTNLNSGVDCSGFVYSVYKNFGVTLYRSSRDMYSNGKSVDKSSLQAGDLVFFNTGGKSVISHVGIYVGNGQYIHSTNGKAMGVTISSLSSAYSSNTYVGAKRIL